MMMMMMMKWYVNVKFAQRYQHVFIQSSGALYSLHAKAERSWPGIGGVTGKWVAFLQIVYSVRETTLQVHTDPVPRLLQTNHVRQQQRAQGDQLHAESSIQSENSQGQFLSSVLTWWVEGRRFQ